MGELAPWELWLRKQVKPPARKRAPTRAQKAAIERRLAVYLHLRCGDWSTAEEQEAVISKPPRKGVYWCSNCQEWKELLPKPVRPELPDVPEF